MHTKTEEERICLLNRQLWKKWRVSGVKEGHFKSCSVIQQAHVWSKLIPCFQECEELPTPTHDLLHDCMFLKWDRWSCQEAAILTSFLLSGPWQLNNTPCQRAHTHSQTNSSMGRPEVHSPCCVWLSVYLPVCQTPTSWQAWCTVWPETRTSFPLLSRLPLCVCGGLFHGWCWANKI